MKKIILVLCSLGLVLMFNGCDEATKVKVADAYNKGKSIVKKARKVVDVLPIPPTTKAKILVVRGAADVADNLATKVAGRVKGNDAVSQSEKNISK